MKIRLLDIPMNVKFPEQIISGSGKILNWLFIFFFIIIINSVLCAQVITTYTDSLTIAQQFKRPNIAAQGNIVASAWASQNGQYDYVVQKFTIPLGGAGNYTIETTATRFNGDQDPMLFVYTNDFDPNSPLSNGIVGNDDIQAGVQRQSKISNYFLPAGDYTLVVTVWAAGVSGGVDYKFTGPAAVAIRSVPILGSIETPALEYSVGNTPVILTSTIAAFYTNNAPLTGATVQITGNYHSSEDVLSFTDQNGITGSWNSSTGTMTLSGTTLSANYQSALRSITYNNSSQSPNLAARTISFTTWGGTTSSGTCSRTLNILAQTSNIRFNNLSTSSFIVSWTPASTYSYLVVRRSGSAPTFTPVNGTEYTTGVQGADNIVYVGNGSSLTETGMSVNTDYYYKIYTYQGSGGSAVYASTISPLQGINRVLDTNTTTSNVPVTTNVISREFPDNGVSVIFTSGTPGTTLTVTKVNSSPTPSSNFSTNGNLYFTVHSTNPSPGTYSIVLDFSSLNYSNWDSYKVLKRSDESSPWQDVTQAPINAVITNRSTDGIPGKFTITGLTSFSQFVLGGVSSGSSTQSITILSPIGKERFQGGSLQTIAWRKGGFFPSVKMEYTTDNGDTWQAILPDGKEQPLVGLTSFPWQVPTGINSSQCKIRVSNWNDLRVYGESLESFTIYDIKVNQPDSGTVLNVGSIATVSWNGGILTAGSTKIEFSTDGGYSWGEIGQTTNSVTKSINWKIPEVQSNLCKVRIVQMNNTGISGSNKGYFRIQRLNGDVSGDGQLTAYDACQIMDFLIGTRNFDRNQLSAGDVDGDGQITIEDAYRVLYNVVFGNFPNTLGKTTAEGQGKIILGQSIENNMYGENGNKKFTIPVTLTACTGKIHTADIKLNIDSKYAEIDSIESTLPNGWFVSHNYSEGRLNILMTGTMSVEERTILKIVVSLKSEENHLSINGTAKINGNAEQNINEYTLTQIPKQYNLSQNYPNPFNPTTSIKYGLSYDSHVKLSVYNSLGQKVLQLVDKTQNAGDYNVSLNGMNLATGTYIYVIEANSVDGKEKYKSAMKMLLLK